MPSLDAECPKRRPPVPSGSVSLRSSATSTKPNEESHWLPEIAPGKKRKLDESGTKLLEEDLHARPAVSYEQRAEFLHKLLGVKVSKSTICRMIKRMGYTRKKGAWVRVKEMSS